MLTYKYFRKNLSGKQIFLRNFRTNKYFREQFRKNLAKSYHIEYVLKSLLYTCC
jgi:hypothetical protein